MSKLFGSAFSRCLWFPPVLERGPMAEMVLMVAVPVMRRDARAVREERTRIRTVNFFFREPKSSATQVRRTLQKRIIPGSKARGNIDLLPA